MLDKERKEIGMHERVINGDTIVDMYFKLASVNKKDLVDLFINKKIVASKLVKAALIVKMKDEQEEKILANKTEDENGNPLFATVFVKVDRLYSKDVNGRKFLYAIGEMKARLPEPPKQLSSTVARAQVDNSYTTDTIAVMKSKFNCPTLNFNLTESLANIFGDDTIKQIFGGIN